MERLGTQERNKSFKPPFRRILIFLANNVIGKIDQAKIPNVIKEAVNNMKVNALIEWGQEAGVVPMEEAIRDMEDVDFSSIQVEAGDKILFHGSGQSMKLWRKRLREGPRIRVCLGKEPHTSFSDKLSSPGQYAQREATPYFGLVVEYHLPKSGIARGMIGSKTDTFWGLLPENPLIIRRIFPKPGDPMEGTFQATLDPVSIKALHICIYDESSRNNESLPRVLTIRGNNEQLVAALYKIEELDVLR